MTTTGSTAQVLDSTGNRALVSVRTVAQQAVMSSYEASALDVTEYARAVIDYSKSDGEVNRRAATQRRIDILRDKWGPLLKAGFQNWVTPQVYDAVTGANHDHIDLSRNPAKHIWQELAVTYKNPPRRSTPDDPADVEKYNKLLEGTHFDLWWQQVELLAEACNDVLIWPEFVTRNGKTALKHRVAAGNTFTIVASDDDPSEVEAILFPYKYRSLINGDVERYVLWTDKWSAAFEDTKDGPLPVGEVSEQDGYNNPYDEMLFTLVHMYPWSDSVLDTTSGEDLIDLTLRSGEERLFYRYLQKMSGFKQLAVSGTPDKPPTQMTDPGAIITIPGPDVNLTLIDWEVDLGKRQACLDADELRAAASRGINPERYKRTGNYQSGHGAKLAERGLSERRLRNAPIWQWAEQEYKRHTSIKAEKHNVADAPNPDVKLEVNHAPSSYPGDPKAQAEVDVVAISLGLASPVTIMMRDNPNLTEKEALEIIKTNMEHTAVVQRMKVTHNIPNNPTTESASAEQNGALGGRPPATPAGKTPAIGAQDE